MKYARIENGVVKEIINVNPQGRYTPELVAQFVECPDNVQQYYTYSNGVFTPPVPIITPPTPADIAKEEYKNVDKNSTSASDFKKRLDIIETIIGLKGG